MFNFTTSSFLKSRLIEPTTTTTTDKKAEVLNDLFCAIDDAIRVEAGGPEEDEDDARFASAVIKAMRTAREQIG